MFLFVCHRNHTITSEVHPANTDAITTNAVNPGVQFWGLEYCGPIGVAVAVARCAATVVVTTTMTFASLPATAVVVANGDSWRTVLSAGSVMAASVVAEDSAVARLELELGTYGTVAVGDLGEV